MGARSTQRWARSLAALPLVTVGLAGAALPAQAAVSGSTVLSGTQSPAATRAHFAGALNQAQSVSFELVMALPDAAGAEALATAVSTPGNASYRHYLTAAQWEARFSPSQSAIANAEAWLEHEGLHVGAVPADRMTIPVTGTIAQIDRAFSTTLANYRVGGETVRLASADLTIPKRAGGFHLGDGRPQPVARHGNIDHWRGHRGINGIRQRHLAACRLPQRSAVLDVLRTEGRHDASRLRQRISVAASLSAVRLHAATDALRL